jgi:hypothetical protein
VFTRAFDERNYMLEFIAVCGLFGVAISWSKFVDDLFD